MRKIDKDEIKHRILETINEDLEKNIDELINKAISELKIEVIDSKVTAEEAEKIQTYISNNLNIDNIAKLKFGVTGLLVACALGVGGASWYHKADDNSAVKSNRYTIEKEYAFMSICVGKDSDYLPNYKTQRQNKCVEILKACQKEGKTLKECVNQ